jgi:hypothetical protein
MKVLMLLGLAASSLTLIVAPGGAASDTPCVGPLTGVHDNVVVPEGQTCMLAGAVIRGNLFVRPQARLTDSFRTPNNVVGNLFAFQAQLVDLENTRVAGDADLKQTRANLTAIGFQGQVFRFRVDEDLLIEESPGVFLSFPRVGGDLDVIKANSPLVSVVVRSVTVGQNLNVRDSVARQIDVRSNEVGGSVQVQNNTAQSNGLVVGFNEVVGNAEIRDNVSIGTSGWFIDNNEVGGNFNLENNLVSGTFTPPVQLNQVGENMAVIRNRGTSAKTITNNTVADTLRCFDNEPPFVGGPNTAPKKEGQGF